MFYLDRGESMAMTLEERLQKAEGNGYTPVHVPSENSYFFVDNRKKFKVGDKVSNSLGYIHTVVGFEENYRLVAIPD